MNSLDSVERRRGHLVNWHVSIFVFNYCFYRKYFHTEYYAAKKRNQFFFLLNLKASIFILMQVNCTFLLQK